MKSNKPVNHAVLRNKKTCKLKYRQKLSKAVLPISSRCRWKKTEVNTKFIHWPAVDHLDVVAGRLHIVFIVLKVTFSEFTCDLEF